MSPQYRRIKVIVNPAAGPNVPILNTLNDVFRQHDIYWEVAVTHRGGDGARLARQAASAGFDLVAVYGGDGTVTDVANGLVGGPLPLAILPGGTGNALAWELGIPQRLSAAAELICRDDARLRTLDAGRINGHYFLLRANVGLQAEVTQRASREMKDRFGLLAYAISALTVLSEPERYRQSFYLTLDGREVESEGVTCLVANSGNIGGLNVKLAASIDPADGLLDVFVLNDDLDSMLSMAASIVALEEFSAALEYWQCQEVSIATDKPQPVRVDGEEFGHTPITASLEPEALRVLVP